MYNNNYLYVVKESEEKKKKLLEKSGYLSNTTHLSDSNNGLKSEKQITTDLDVISISQSPPSILLLLLL